MDLIVFDIEVKPEKKYGTREIAIIAWWDDVTHTMTVREEKDGGMDFIRYAIPFAVVGGYNVRGYDIKQVLAKIKRPTIVLEKTFDLLYEIRAVSRKMPSLEDLARLNLKDKRKFVLKVPVASLWPARKDLIIKRCVSDVEIARDLIYYVIRTGSIMIPWKSGARTLDMRETVEKFYIVEGQAKQGW